MKKLELNYMAYADLFGRLALLIHSGLTTGDALSILAQDEQDKQYAALLTKMSKQLEEGSSLAAALSESKCFPSHAIGMIDAAERVGRTEETLTSLSHYYENRERAAQDLRNALTYPSILLLVMTVVIVILLSKVLPVFDEVYGSFGGSLSGIAGGLLLVGNVLSSALPFIGIIIGAIVVIVAAVSFIPSASKAVKKFFVGTFGDRGVMRKMNNAQFTQVLAITLASGLSVEEGIELAENMFSDCPAAALRCKHCRELIENGTELSDALRQTELLSGSACSLLSLGMRTGNADAVIEKISSDMADEAEEALAASVARVEPAMVIITSVIVGIILLSVMFPLINIMKAIG